jgi:hypothetical protein
MAYYSLDPFGDDREDLRAGVIAATVANASRDPEKGKAFEPGDFFLLGKEPDPEQDAEKKSLEMLTRLQNAMPMLRGNEV